MPLNPATHNEVFYKCRNRAEGRAIQLIAFDYGFIWGRDGRCVDHFDYDGSYNIFFEARGTNAWLPPFGLCHSEPDYIPRDASCVEFTELIDWLAACRQ